MNMPSSTTDNTRIINTTELITPADLKQEIPMTQQMEKSVTDSRDIVSNILHGKDPRQLVITGPCSIHNYENAMEYATWLKEIQQKCEHLYLVMRVYFEKPRTTVGWKGLINDPNMDESYDINGGLTLARKIFHDIAEMGVPIGSEQLDLNTPQYTSDLVTWSAIGARTTESQGHREMASGLSSPVGFKNGSGGSTKIAIDGMYAAQHPQSFISVSGEGRASQIHTSGNQDSHIILRGGSQGPNYSPEDILLLETQLQERGLEQMIIVDASHANAEGNHMNQLKVVSSVAEQIKQGNRSIKGIMLESNMGEGSQPFTVGVTDPNSLAPGVSVTDKCINISDTKSVLTELNTAAGIGISKIHD